jgi:large repetitive protein
MNNLIKKSRLHRFSYRESVAGAFQKALLMMVMTFSMSALVAQQIWNFSYTGSVQTFTATTAGTYDLQLWGASGGNDGQIGGKGGYATAKMALTAGQSINIYVAGQGTGCVTNSGGGWNGGGNAGTAGCSGGGGGATDIRSGGTALANRVIVAGGGGGGGNGGLGVGGAGGGLTGQAASGGGGTQSAGGSGTGAGSLGQGGNRSGDGGGGGGGYYGGGAATGDAGGGGGSGYVSSSLSSASLIAGNLSMPNPSGGTMTGRSGHGYARITLSASASISQTATILCNGASTGALTAVGAGGTAPYTYSWSNGATSDAITGLAAGTYTVTVTATGGFTATASSTLTQPTAVSATISSQVNVLCNGASTGSAAASATGGTPNYTYSWSNGAAVATATGLAAGTYSVTATDANGCTSTASVTITQPVAASATITSQTNVLCNGASTGAATASTTGGTNPYNFVWSNGATTASSATSSITGLAAGTYGVTSTDANGCTSTASVTITEPTALVASIATQTNVACNGGSTGTTTVSVSGGVSPYTYVWSNADTSATTSGLAVGTYTVTTTDANGCTSTASATITEPTAVIATISSQVNVLCNGGANGSATASATGGTGLTTYLWSNAATGATASGLAAGSYTVTATDSNGCTSTATATITEPAVLVSTASLTNNALCNGGASGAATVAATGGTPNYTYSWSNGAILATAAGLTAGTYSVTITDANGCTDSSSVVITEPTAVSTSITSQTNVLCNGASTGAAAVSTTGGTNPYNFVWSNGATTASSATSSITGLAAGTYGVTSTDANGCTSTASVTITEPTALVASIATQTNVACNGGSTGTTTVSVSGGVSPYTYVWSNADTSATTSGLAVGTYTVTTTDANGCTSTASATITEPTAVIATISSQVNVLCNGGANGSATVTSTGGTGTKTYLWSNAATGATATGLAAGSYTVTATDANGCTSIATATITEPLAPVSLSITSQTSAACNGGTPGSATVVAVGGTGTITYLWSNGLSTATASSLPAGSYTVTATDVNACSSTIPVVITEITTGVASIAQTNVACNGGSTGSATISIAGGSSPFTYAWSNSSTDSTATGLAQGSYSVSVTDAIGCTSINSVTITEPAALIASVTIDSNALCNGLSTGGATGTATGGTSPYTYSWSNAATTASITGIAAGTYMLTITDANGCSTSATDSVSEPTALMSMVNIDSNVLCNGGNNGGATATATGGTAPYAYAWSNASTTASITGIAAGTYTVTITDTNGCTSTATDSVSEPMALMAMITVDSNVLCNGGADAGVTVMATGGTPGYAYTWNTASTAASITGLSAGVYEVTITDTNNCTTSVIDTIVEPTALAIMMNMDATVACFGTATGTASAMVSGGVAPYAYNWSNGDTAAMATGLNAATYMVMATDSNGCMIMDSIMIAGPASAMTVVVNETSGIVCDGDATGALEATANGGWGDYSFEWNTTATTAAISGLTDGSYSVNVTDSLGCVETASESIVHQFELPVVNLGADTTICNDASIELNAGNDGAAYAWSTTESAQTIVVSDSGSYSVVVTDANGCAGSDEIVISLDDCTGINELGTELSLMVYPNPSRGVFQIESNGFNLNESTVTIIDLRGNVVSTIRPQGAVRETITLNQPSGVYFLSIEVDGNVAQQRIIIQ